MESIGLSLHINFTALNDYPKCVHESVHVGNLKNHVVFLNVVCLNEMLIKYNGKS